MFFFSFLFPLISMLLFDAWICLACFTMGLFGYSWKLKMKTEKYCSKIIFKCVNNIVGPIFNEKVDKKWYLWVREQCTNALFTVEKVSLYGWKQKKKKKKFETRCAPRRGRKTRKPNIAYVSFLIYNCHA